MPYVTDGNRSLSNSVHPDQQTLRKQRTQQAEEVSGVTGSCVGIKAYDGLLVVEVNG